MPIAEPAVTHQTLTPRDPVHRADSVETQELHPPDAVDDGRFPSNMSLDSDAVSPSGSDHGTPSDRPQHEDHVATCGAVFVVGDVKYCLLPAHTFQKRQVESGKRESEGSSKHDDEEGFTFGGFDEEQNQHSSQEDYQEEGDKDDVLRTPYRDSRATTSDSTGPKQPKPQSHEARYEKSDTPHLTLEPGIGNCLTASGDLDYALLETDMDLTDHPQLPILKPFTISDIPDTETAVTTVTSASGVVEGILTGESVMVRLNGGANFQRVFVVELDHPIQPGDSGSIVRDKANNMIYGHIVAGSKDTNFGLVVSANTVMEDFIRWLLSKARTQIRLRRQE
ncbi:hypothetical protein F4780DRAFT_779978 [Xylariomycetidae sp. FL0641]|nr:hypothetical protein F4780DRAFT_779978 [Xylariomycetidae sp. FL0641]